MQLLIFRIFAIVLVIIFLFVKFFIGESRYSIGISNIFNVITGMVSSNVAGALVLSLFTGLLVSNILGNIPLASIPTLFYSVTLSLSVLF